MSDMEKVKPVLIPTLVELVKLKAHAGFVPLSTEVLSQRLGQSQQSASQHLRELESMGYVERRRSGKGSEARLTAPGQEVVRAYYASLRAALEAGSKRTIEFTGRVFKGLGEGAYYIGLEGYKTQFAKALGFQPYPGTLNLKLESPSDVERKKELRGFDGLRIEGFQRDGRTYGGARCYRAALGKKGLPGAVLVIDRTHYDDSVMEIIAPDYLRDALALNDGEQLRVSASLS
ncbi:MAG: CTP-dependent riboflavin kinase [Nitrososphaerota archaeon]|nr:CTP-dependent riboflavin kinase [Nitrososphaerota archaeon]